MKAEPELQDFDSEIDLGPGGFDLSNSFWNSPTGHDRLDIELRGRLYAVRADRSFGDTEARHSALAGV
jgi:hypothetical protein